MFFIIHHGTRELVIARVTAHSNSKWLAQQMVEACGISRKPPRYLIHDRDGCFGASFNRRVVSLGIRQIRTPVKAPKANAIAERWVRSIRNECLDHRLIFGQHHLQRTVDEFVDYYNRWRPTSCVPMGSLISPMEFLRPTGLLRQLALPAPLYPDHKWPEDSSTTSAMCLERQRDQAPLTQ